MSTPEWMQQYNKVTGGAAGKELTIEEKIKQNKGSPSTPQTDFRSNLKPRKEFDYGSPPPAVYYGAPKVEESADVVEEEVVEEVYIDEDGNEVVEVEEEIIEETDEEAQQRILNQYPKKTRSRMSPVLPFLACAIVAGAIVAVGLLVFLEDGVSTRAGEPTAAPTPIDFKPLNPTSAGAVDVAVTTRFDPIQTGDCDFGSLTQPHVIDQCACSDSIAIVAEDVQARYASLLETFVPTVFDDFNETISSCSPSNQALVWMSTGLNNGGEASNAVREQRFALAYFYMEQGGTTWTESDNWLSESDVCTWDRITCDGNGVVEDIDLADNGVTGELSSAFTILDGLEGFSVTGNDVSGTIPPEIFLSPSLKDIDLSDNALSGEIPPLGSSIEILNLSSNNLSGPLGAVEGAQSLTHLDVTSNALEGPLPVALFGSPLEILSIGSNAFTGDLPTEISNAVSLTHATLGPNEFSGEIPESLGSLSNLVKLSLTDIPSLGGRILKSWGTSLTNLEELVITGTNIGGNIPDNYGNFEKLVILNLSNNDMRGKLPEELGQMTSLKILNLEGNAFFGTIPSEVGNIALLEELLLSSNSLSGDLPSELGSLTNLETLALDGNIFEGRAPTEICALRDEEVGELDTFVVDCPERTGVDSIVGIICTIPSCCTECV